MINYKKIALLGMVGVLTASLVGCGKETRTYTFSEAYDNVAKETYYEAKSDISLKIDGKDLSADLQSAADILNTAKITARIKHDGELQQDEVTLGVHANTGMFSMDLELPVLVDSKNQKGYIKTKSIEEKFGTMVPEIKELFAEAGGSILEFNLQDEELSDYAGDIEKLQKTLSEQIKNIATEAEKQSQRLEVTKDEKERGIQQKIKVIFTKEQINDALVKILSSVDSGMVLSNKEEMLKIVEEMGINDVDLTLALDKNGRILTENFNLSLQMKEQEFQGNITFSIENTYQNYGKKPVLSIDPLKEKDEIITQEQLEKLVAGYSGYQDDVDQDTTIPAITETDAEVEYRQQVVEKMYGKMEPELTLEEKEYITPESLSIFFTGMSIDTMKELEVNLDTMDSQEFMESFRAILDAPI